MWRREKLGNVTEVNTGNPAPQDDSLFVDGHYPFVRTSDVGSIKTGRLNSSRDLLNERGIQRLKLFPKGTVLFPKSGASTFLNHRVILDIEAYVASHLATIKANNDILLDSYIWYFLQTIDAAKLVTDSGYPSLQTNTIKEIEISFPPLAEQERIVTKLSAIFSKIDEALENQNIKIFQIQSLFNSYISKVFRNNQKSWKSKPLKDLCEDYKKNIVDGPFGSNLKSEHFVNEGIPVLKIQNIKKFSINQKKLSYVSQKKFYELKRHTFKTGDIIMTKLGQPLGISAIVKDIKEGVIVADLVRIRANKINTDFLCYQLNSPIVNTYINSMQKGTTRPRIKLSIVRELPISFPNSDIQEQIVREIKEFKSHIDIIKKSYEAKIRNLNLLKSSLINDLLNNYKSTA